MNIYNKRYFDIFFSLLGIIIFLPISLLISILIKIDSQGSVLFKQERRTKNGRIFMMYKFRSMYINSEKNGTGLFNYSNDPRVTKVGKILRKTSLDEIPQLINVIKGDMSLVGPRPCVIYELGDFNTLNKKYKKRFEVLAGITGLAQIEGRNENSWEEKVYYDNQYVELLKKQGFYLDLKILFFTIIKVIGKNRIYEKKIDESLDDIKAAELAEQEIIRLAHLSDEDNLGGENEK